jgi:predicted dehydrogenase
LLPIISSCERGELAAICGRNRERADEIAAKYSIPQVYSDYRQMIDEGKLDAVMVASPDDMHYEMTMYALDAGLHVMCDKPLANNADHARQMYEGQAYGDAYLALAAADAVHQAPDR